MAGSSPALIGALAAAALLAGCRAASDADLHAAVVVRLAMDPITAPLRLEAIVAGGVVRLVGDTPTRADQRHAIAVAGGVEGIREVRSELRLSDRSIQLAVEQALAAEAMLKDITIAVMVSRGVVRLEGGGTDRFQRARAVTTAAQVDGVIAVEDYMR